MRVDVRVRAGLCECVCKCVCVFGRSTEPFNINNNVDISFSIHPFICRCVYSTSTHNFKQIYAHWNGLREDETNSNMRPPYLRYILNTIRTGRRIFYSFASPPPSSSSFLRSRIMSYPNIAGPCMSPIVRQDANGYKSSSWSGIFLNKT